MRKIDTQRRVVTLDDPLVLDKFLTGQPILRRSVGSRNKEEHYPDVGQRLALGARTPREAGAELGRYRHVKSFPVR